LEQPVDPPLPRFAAAKFPFGNLALGKTLP